MGKVLSIFFHNIIDHRQEGDLYHSKQLTSLELYKALEYVKFHYTPLSLAEFLDVSLRGRTGHFAKQPIFISFDDGHLGTFVHGAPVLEELQVPATVFVLGKPLIDSKFVPPYMEWVYLVRNAANRQGSFRGQAYGLDTPAAYEFIRQLWLACRAETYGPFLDEVSEAFGALRPTLRQLPPDLAYVTREKLKVFASNQYLTLGSHAMSHMPLGWLDPAQQRRELLQSHELLCSIGNYQRVVSYPDGSHDQSARQAAAEIYQFAFAVEAGANWRDPFAYPRQCIASGCHRNFRYALSRRRRYVILPAKAALKKLLYRRAAA